MTAILRVKLRWSGFIGGPGYTIFHFRDFGGTGEWNPGPTEALGAVGRVDTFAGKLIGKTARGVTLNVMGDVEEIEDTTGQLIDVHSVATPAARVSPSIAGQRYVGGTGAVINWRTSLVRNGRRIRGRSFLVPLDGNVFEDNGTLSAQTIADLQTAGNELIAEAGAPDLGVYARPTAPGAADGLWAHITSCNIPDLGAQLRSRRD